jgi:hypothetical protein
LGLSIFSLKKTSRRFRWSPNAGALLRQLTGNGLYAARRVASALARNPHPDNNLREKIAEKAFFLTQFRLSMVK